MSKKVLVISTSLRKGGNSETLADEFIRGAKEAGSVDAVGTIAGHTALKKAFEMGQGAANEK